MLAQMPHRIFQDWLKYSQEEPFGQMPMRLGYASAMLGSLLGKPKGRRGWKVADFMPDNLERAPKKTSPEEQLNKIHFIAQMMGAKIVDPKGVLKHA